MGSMATAWTIFNSGSVSVLAGYRLRKSEPCGGTSSEVLELLWIML